MALEEWKILLKLNFSPALKSRSCVSLNGIDVAITSPSLAGVSGGVKTCVAALVRYVGSGHDMAMLEMPRLLFLGRTFAVSVGDAHQSVCFLSRLSIDESIGSRSLTCIS